MRSKDTFKVPAINDLVKRYLSQSSVSIDPFARNSERATYTNDLNPQTSAQHHMDVLDFLKLMQEQGVKADLVLFDPPYSPTQMKRSYESFGLRMDGKDATRTGWKQERDILADILTDDAVSISFGWNTIGMGQQRGFEIMEILIVCHGGSGANDTLVTVEKRGDVADQLRLSL